MSPLEISLAKIRAPSSLERKTLLHRGLKLSEEVGELSEALLAIEDAPGWHLSHGRTASLKIR